MMKRSYGMILKVMFLLLMILSIHILQQQTFVFAAEEMPQVIRVGWFEYAGFFSKDANGMRSGYGYDYLQELARYGGWRYEYVEGTPQECLNMLAEGKIDLLGALMYSPQREELFDFSHISMGRNFSVLTVRADDARYLDPEADLNGIRIALLNPDYRMKCLQEYAQQKNFTYRTVLYDTPALMEKAQENKEVDALLTTNMRVSGKKERLIAQFAPEAFYFAVKKGNDRIMDPVNRMMEKIMYYQKDLPSVLSQKYFSVDRSSVLVFTEQEQAYLREHPVISVALTSDREPIAYEKNGKAYGIVVDILNEIAARIGVQFRYIPYSHKQDSIQAVISGKADILSHAYTNYGWAENQRLFLSYPFMELEFVSVRRRGETLDFADQALRVAAVSSYRFTEDYVLRNFASSQITWYDNEEQCIDAVGRGEQDVCFVSYYVADFLLEKFCYRHLYFSTLNFSNGISIGTEMEKSIFLRSILDKAILSMGKANISGIALQHIVQKKRDRSFYEIFLQNPLLFAGIGVTMAVLFITVCVLLYKRKKNRELYQARMAARRDSLTKVYNRYAYELCVDEFLSKASPRQRQESAFVMIDIDDFKAVNDSFGHSYGDQTLVALAEGLKQAFAENAVICRMGGDEFSLFLTKIASEEALLKKMQEAQRGLAAGKYHEIAVQVSMGGAMATAERANFVDLYEAADGMLYCAKQSGKGKASVG